MQGVLSFNGKVKEWKNKRNIEELRKDFDANKDRTEAIRSFIDNTLTLEQKKELADELTEEVIETADINYLCRECLVELQETGVEYQDAGVCHGRPVQEPITVELTCPVCGERREM